MIFPFKTSIYFGAFPLLCLTGKERIEVPVRPWGLPLPPPPLAQLLCDTRVLYKSAKCLQGVNSTSHWKPGKPRSRINLQFIENWIWMNMEYNNPWSNVKSGEMWNHPYSGHPAVCLFLRTRFAPAFGLATTELSKISLDRESFAKRGPKPPMVKLQWQKGGPETYRT